MLWKPKPMTRKEIIKQIDKDVFYVLSIGIIFIILWVVWYITDSTYIFKFMIYYGVFTILLEINLAYIKLRYYIGEKNETS